MTRELLRQEKDLTRCRRLAIDIRKLLTTYLDSPIVYTPAYPRQQLSDVNTDLFPKDEFDLSPR